MQGYALADRQIEVGLCSLAVPVLSRHGQVVAALNVGVPAATVSAAALKEKALAPPRRAAMDLSLDSYSAVCGFVTGEVAPDPGGQQQKHDPRCRQHQTAPG